MTTTTGGPATDFGRALPDHLSVMSRVGWGAYEFFGGKRNWLAVIILLFVDP
ncbi:MAG TPA: hypothetical protein VE130_05000 [Nitrososphaeraceae archaeon]|nr:hypothetical protein [Nitrososphaeraceae archaeon]